MLSWVATRSTCCSAQPKPSLVRSSPLFLLSERSRGWVRGTSRWRPSRQTSAPDEMPRPPSARSGSATPARASRTPVPTSGSLDRSRTESCCCRSPHDRSASAHDVAETVTIDLVTHSRIEIAASAASIWPHILEPKAWKQGLQPVHHSGPAQGLGERQIAFGEDGVTVLLILDTV